MKNLIINQRDQKFNLYEMLDIVQIFKNTQYQMFSQEDFDLILSTSLNLALNECYPAMREADRQGCEFRAGTISVPEVFHQLKKKFDSGGWSSLLIPREFGGQEFSTLMYLASCEPFMHNLSFFQYTNRPLGTADVLINFGNADQKNRYLKKIAEGKWAGPVALTESDAGSDSGVISTKAVKQSDGSYRISGTKIMITNGDSDLFDNYVYIVGARIEGAPPGIGGISFFLVPKYLVNENGTIGERNDYNISGLDKKMGLHGLVTCTTHFGENGNCYGEIIGQENMGYFMLSKMLMKAQLNIGLFCTGIASSAYLHALNYAKERIQGPRLSEALNPVAPRVPIIEHLDIRRMLLGMKANVEGMRALIYYCGWLSDMIEISQDSEEKRRLKGIRLLLTPICTAFCSDTAFDVTKDAMQVYGSAGYFQDHPVEQFMRDVKVASFYEGSNGFAALQMLAMNMGKDDKNFHSLTAEISNSIAEYDNNDQISDLAYDLHNRLVLLNQTRMFLNTCNTDGNPLVPFANATLFLQMIGIITIAWQLLKQAGTAHRRLSTLLNDSKMTTVDTKLNNSFFKDNQEVDFYNSKIMAARYYCKNCLPRLDALSQIIMHGDMTINSIKNDAF